MPTSLHVRALRPIADGNQSCRRAVPGSQSVGVEADVRNAGPVGQAAAGQGLFQVEVRQADASLAASFADALPADVLLLCGIFGKRERSPTSGAPFRRHRPRAVRARP